MGTHADVSRDSTSKQASPLGRHPRMSVFPTGAARACLVNLNRRDAVSTLKVRVSLWALRKGQLNRHTRYRPATTTRNTATQWSRRSEGGFPQEKGQQIFERTKRPLGTDYRLWQYLARAKLSEIHFPKSPLRRSTMCDDLLFEKGSVESTHKVPTSHYHAKHRLALPGARCGRVARWTNAPARIFKDPAPTPTSQSVPPTPPTALRRPLRPAASSLAVRS